VRQVEVSENGLLFLAASPDCLFEGSVIRSANIGKLVPA